MTAARARSSKTGLPPGTLVHIGEAGAGPAILTLMDYDGEHVAERRLDSPEEIPQFLGSETVSWINVCGVHDVDAVARVGAILGIHPLVLEDIVNTHQRPKAEVFDGHLFAVLRMLRYDAEYAHVDSEQVSLILGPRYVITFQERPGDVFDAVRQRIRAGKGRVIT